MFRKNKIMLVIILLSFSLTYGMQENFESWVRNKFLQIDSSIQKIENFIEAVSRRLNITYKIPEIRVKTEADKFMSSLNDLMRNLNLELMLFFPLRAEQIRDLISKNIDLLKKDHNAAVNTLNSIVYRSSLGPILYLLNAIDFTPSELANALEGLILRWPSRFSNPILRDEAIKIVEMFIEKGADLNKVVGYEGEEITLEEFSMKIK